MEKLPNTSKKLITRKEACQRYGISLRHLDELLRAGVLPHIRLGRRCIRIPLDKADASLESLTTGGRK